MSVYSLEYLSRSHDRDGFDCGIDPLNAYLKQTARQHSERGIARTSVLVETNATEPKRILGYFTLSLCQVKGENLPSDVARKTPREAGAVKMGRLAVATTHQRQGIGRHLMAGAMQHFLDIYERGGGIGLFVDAKDATAAEYYARFGFIPLPHNPLQLFLPTKTIQSQFAQ
jgi:ribosomal protein S18 acetylase RimI-like enzyme